MLVEKCRLEVQLRRGECQCGAAHEAVLPREDEQQIHGIVGHKSAVQRRVELLLLPRAQRNTLILSWDISRSRLLRQQQQGRAAYVLDVKHTVTVDVAVEGVHPNRAAAARAVGLRQCASDTCRCGSLRQL